MESFKINNLRCRAENLKTIRCNSSPEAIAPISRLSSSVRVWRARLRHWDRFTEALVFPNCLKLARMPSVVAQIWALMPNLGLWKTILIRL